MTIIHSLVLVYAVLIGLQAHSLHTLFAALVLPVLFMNTLSLFWSGDFFFQSKAIRLYLALGIALGYYSLYLFHS